MNRTRIALVFGAALLLGGLVVVPQARALTLVPPSLEYDVNPGQTVDAKIKLFNEGTAPTTVFASAANFTAKDETGTPDFDFAETLTDLASWMELPQGGVTLAAGDRLEIPVTIRVPADAEPGGHYASVFFGTDPSVKPEGGGQVNIRSLIGTLVIMKVAGEVTESAKLAQFDLLDGKRMLTRLPGTLFVRIENDGNVHVRPEGTVVVTNMFGKESARLTLNDVNGAVLPKSARRFDVTWAKDETAFQSHGFLGEVAAEWRNFALGTYTATLNGTYGSTSQPITATVKFTVIPWHLLAVEFLVLALVVFLLVWGIRRYNAVIIRRAGGSTPTSKRS